MAKRMSPKPEHQRDRNPIIADAALRVLNSHVTDRSPAPADVQALRNAAPEPQSGWESGPLAEYILARELNPPAQA